jgi:hypothetical protein
LDCKPFNFLQHYCSIYTKYNKFVRDYKLLAHIAAIELKKKNPVVKCHFHDNEPLSHAKAKNKIFELFLRNSSYLVETELRPPDKQLNVFHKGDMAYQFDLLIINVANYITLQSYIMTANFSNNDDDLKEAMKLEQSLIFNVEIDGESHRDKKDLLRDEFFFDEYNIITVRYRVDQLIKMEETEKERKARVRFSFFKKNTDPIYEHITTDQIVQEVRNIYRTKYPHLS